MNQTILGNKDQQQLAHLLEEFRSVENRRGYNNNMEGERIALGKETKCRNFHKRNSSKIHHNQGGFSGTFLGPHTQRCADGW
mmetsp:Transcript_45940/g.112083  ORF Transcript_45940/g.112083 Transcript_45940/m.112083 type:complete len:82 (-) Transcript_45940:2599-2844(-)